MTRQKVRKIKGGAPRSPPPSYQPTQESSGKLSASQMYYEKHMFDHLMYKPHQVKTPESMPVNENYLNQLELLKVLADFDVQSPVLEKYEKTYSGHETYEECMELSHDSMLMALLEAYSIATVYSDPDDVYDRGFLKLLKILVALFYGNPYTRDRIGWFMWSIGKHISPNVYFPLELDLYYDPRLWHRPGENRKPNLPIPASYAFDRKSQDLGPSDDIWDCDIPGC